MFDDRTPAEVLAEAAEMMEQYPYKSGPPWVELFRKAEKEYRSRETMIKWNDPEPHPYGPVDLTGSGWFGKTYWEIAYEIALNLTEVPNGI